MKNKIIRHAESATKVCGDEVLNFLSEEGIIGSINCGKNLVEITEIITSPQIRAIETGYWINYGYELEKLLGFEKKADMKKSVIRRSEDKRIDVANFLQGYSPHQVGCQKAYQHLIEHTPREIYTIAQRFASFVVSKLDNSGVLAVSHDIPISVFLYAIGINEIDSATSSNLQGFSFYIDKTVDTKHPVISVDERSDMHSDRYLVEMDYLESLIENRAHCRPHVRRLN